MNENDVVNIDAESKTNIANAKDALQLVSFNIGDEEFAINILNIQEIIRLTDITRAPHAPEFVIGVINLRGKVIPIINLRMRLGLPRVNDDSNSRIIVVECETKIIGFLVDKVNEVIRIDSIIAEAPPKMTEGVNKKFISSIAKLEDRLIIMLNLKNAIMDEVEECVAEIAN
jgi:purine-binding chemotaxis protein CheW